MLYAVVRKHPFARLLVFYVSGILFAMYVCPEYKATGLWLPLVTISFLLIVLFISGRFPRYHTGWLSGIIASVVLFIAGIMNIGLHFRHGDNLKQAAGFKGTIMMEIAEPAVNTEKSVKCIARIIGTNEKGSWVGSQQKIMVYFEKDSSSISLVPGNKIICNARLTGILPPSNPGEFNYKKFLAARNIYNQVYVPSAYWKPLSDLPGISLKTAAWHAQRALLEKYKKIGLDKTMSGILSALTLGYKSDLEAHTIQAFSQAGVMHVMALSGFNVAVIAWAIGHLLFFTERVRYGKIIKTAIIIVFIWIFAFITGLSPSVTRASVMISMVMAGKVIHRHINTMNILYASAFVLLTLSPPLINDVSFQLSFAAVFGILIFYPPLSRLISFKYILFNKIWQLFSVSCAAQLSTLPLTLFYFHQFPVYFWLTNLYVIPLVSVIVCVTGIYLIVSFIEPLMIITGKILAFLLDLLYRGIVLTDIMPYSLIENIRIDKVQVMLLVLTLLIAGLYLFQKRISYVLTALSLIIAIQVISLFRTSARNKQQLVMIGNYKGQSAINIIDGRKSVLLSDIVLDTGDPKISYAFMNFWVQRGVAGRVQARSVKNLTFRFAGCDFMVLTDDDIFRRNIEKPLQTDFLVITNAVKPDIDKLLGIITPAEIIIDSSVPFYKSEKWLSLCEERNIECWSVTRQGAWVLDKDRSLKFRQRQSLAGK